MALGGSPTIITDNVTLSGTPRRPEEPGPQPEAGTAADLPGGEERLERAPRDRSGGALDLLAHEPHVARLVLDYAMPGMTGAALACEIAGTRRDGLALFITGNADLGALRTLG